MKERLDVYEQVSFCEACPRHKEGAGPICFTGPTPAKVAVLGESPSRHDNDSSTLFQDEAGQKIKGIIKGLLELDPAEVFWCNTVSCWGEDKPSKVEVAACTSNKLDQLALAAAPWLLVLGDTALRSFHPQIPVGKMRGRFFEPSALPGTTAFVTYHPAAALRKSSYESDIISDLRAFKATMLAGRWAWEKTIDHAVCIVCDNDLICWYADGIPLCEKHAPAAFHHAAFDAGLANRKLKEGAA